MEMADDLTDMVSVRYLVDNVDAAIEDPSGNVVELFRPAGGR